MSLLLEMFTYPFILRAFVVGILVALCAALLGVPLVLKRYSMIGDGLSHVSFGALSVAVACGWAPLPVSIPVVVIAALGLLRMTERSKLGVLELKDRCYRELSGGQQQRVLLARALCAAGELLILDEPVTGLDPAAAQDLYRTLDYLNKTEGIAIVMVTHDMENALRCAGHILYVGHGSHFFGTVQEYLASPMGRRFGGAGA